MITDLNDQRVDRQSYREPFCENYSRCLTLAAAPEGKNHLDCKGCTEAQIKPLHELSEMKNENPNACYALIMEVLFLLDKRSQADKTPLGHKIPTDSDVGERRLLWRFFKNQFRSNASCFH